MSGHMAVKLGKAMGLEVTVISTSEKKREEAIKTLGADHFIVSKNDKEMLVCAPNLSTFRILHLHQKLLCPSYQDITTVLSTESAWLL